MERGQGVGGYQDGRNANSGELFLGQIFVLIDYSTLVKEIVVSICLKIMSATKLFLPWSSPWYVTNIFFYLKKKRFRSRDS